MTPRCPSDLQLEAHLADPAGSGLASHLGDCGPCRDRLARMEREGEEFRRFVFPATVDAVMDAAGPRRPLRRWLLALAPLSALAAAGLLFALRPVPGPGYLGVKGAPLGLTVFVGGAERARAVTDGERVPAAAALRFQVRASGSCRLWLVSVDASAQVSRLYPAEGDGGAEVGAAGPLPGGAVLDGKGGPERIYAVCAPTPLPFAEVERAAREAVAGGAGAVRAGRPLAGLPAGASQATLLLEKAP